MSTQLGREVVIPEGATVLRGPKTCPACGALAIAWASTVPGLTVDQADPLLDDGQGLAEVFICKTCDAGWIEPEEPTPITWVRPYKRSETVR
jgi:hypothetical protein